MGCWLVVVRIAAYRGRKTNSHQKAALHSSPEKTPRTISKKTMKEDAVDPSFFNFFIGT
jgi:hypothetical protein